MQMNTGSPLEHHSTAVGASPVGVATTASSFSTLHLASINWAKTTVRRETFELGICVAYIRGLTVCFKCSTGPFNVVDIVIENRTFRMTKHIFAFVLYIVRKTIRLTT